MEQEEEEQEELMDFEDADGEDADGEDAGGNDEEDGRCISLEDLASTDHPCLAAGEFSIFNSPDVRSLIGATELQYTIDLDGVIVLSK